MNLIEKLIRVDKETVEKKETKKIRSARLTKLLGEETEITIQEVSGRKHNDIMQMMFDEKGKRNISAAYDTNRKPGQIPGYDQQCLQGQLWRIHRRCGGCNGKS